MITIKRIIGGICHRYDRYVRIPAAQRRFRHIHILTSEESIRYIIEHHCSVSRFGDGEFFVMMGKGNGFQQPDACLAERLKEVILNENETLRYENENYIIKHLVAIPLPLKDTSRLRPSSKEFWGYFSLRYWEELLPLLSTERTYLDTQLSRFYMMYEDKSGAQHQLQLLKQIWDNRDIVIIEGCQSRTGIGNDLYENARSIKRILGPATNAFSKYTEMLNAITDNVTKDKLILLSYGMTATILAYDLARMGYWAIDIGHLDIEYEWMRMGATDNVPVMGKFTNEAVGGNHVDSVYSSQYLSQIITDITTK